MSEKSVSVNWEIRNEIQSLTEGLSLTDSLPRSIPGHCRFVESRRNADRVLVFRVSSADGSTFLHYQPQWSVPLCFPVSQPTVLTKLTHSGPASDWLAAPPSLVPAHHDYGRSGSPLFFRIAGTATHRRILDILSQSQWVQPLSLLRLYTKKRKTWCTVSAVLLVL